MGFPVAGGMNFVMVDWATPNEPKGYLRQFTANQGKITADLAAAYTAGHRRIGLAVPFFEGGDGFALDSSTGQLTPADRACLRGFLATAKQLGFLHVKIEMIPEWNSALPNWPNSAIMNLLGAGVWRPVEACRNFLFTVDVWQETLRAALPDACIDLHAEAIQPDWITAAQPGSIWLRYLNWFWDNWLAQFGVRGTLGFSCIPTPDRIRNIRACYGNGQDPQVWDFHIYGPDADFPTMASTADVWRNTKRSMFDLGLSGPTWGGFEIGETYTNDQECARAFSQPSVAADGSTHPADAVPPLWIHEWPVLRTDPAGATQTTATFARDYYNQVGL